MTTNRDHHRESRAPRGRPSRTPADGPEVQVNGEPRRLPEGCSVADLLELLEREGGLGGAAGDGAEERPAHSVAVAVNREVVPRSRFAERVLGAGDRVEILEAVGGG